jgi:Ala-tRNA(Pro) deacylase
MDDERECGEDTGRAFPIPGFARHRAQHQVPSAGVHRGRIRTASRGDSGGHTKNLFLKDKKDQYFLLTVDEHATVDLKTVHQIVGGASKFSFGKPEKLMEYLGVIPGAVTALGIVNDTRGNVTIVLDADLMKNDIVNCHPLSNDATTSIASSDLIRFVEATGHTAHVLKVTV